MKLYDIKVNDIRGGNVSLESFKGKVLLIVNIATECALAYQLEGFQNLYDSFKDQGFRVLAFPSDSFKKEANDNAGILDKCNTLYKITFPLFGKISVKGDDIHTLYKFLISQKRGFITKGIKFNYTKFLVDGEGNVIKRYGPMTKPDAIRADIRALL